MKGRFFSNFEADGSGKGLLGPVVGPGEVVIFGAEEFELELFGVGEEDLFSPEGVIFCGPEGEGEALFFVEVDAGEDLPAEGGIGIDAVLEGGDEAVVLFVGKPGCVEGGGEAGEEVLKADLEVLAQEEVGAGGVEFGFECGDTGDRGEEEAEEEGCEGEAD